jgi:hypothetical protein
LAFDAVIQIITVLRAADNLKEYWSKKTQVNVGWLQFSLVCMARIDISYMTALTFYAVLLQSEEIKTAVKVSVAKPTELEFKLDDRLHQSIENATLQFEKMVCVLHFFVSSIL